MILVNDGSSDLSGAICDRFARVDARFRVIQKEEKGYSSALNAGLHVAKGEFIGFVNPEDRIDEVMLEKLLLTMVQNQADIVIANYQEEISIKNTQLVESSDTGIWKPEEAISTLFGQFRLKGFLCNKLFARTLFISTPSIQFDPEISVFEDLLFCVQCILKSKKIVYDPNLYYHYSDRHHEFPFSPLTKGKLSGLTELAKVVELTESVGEFDVSIVKDTYVFFAIQLMMHALNKGEQKDPLYQELKKKLVYFELAELKKSNVKCAYILTRSVTKVYYAYWKVAEIKKGMRIQ